MEHIKASATGNTASYDLLTVGSLFVELTPSVPGEPLSAAHHYTLVAGGAAANVVFALARLGVHTGFITAVGDDEFGTLLIDEMASFGVDTASMCRATGMLTPVSFASVDRLGGKQFRFYRFPGLATPMETVTAEDFSSVERCRLFDFSEGSIREPALRPLVFQAACRARAAGIPVLYAVNLRVESWRLPEDEIRCMQQEAIALADVLVLNADEVNYISGCPGEAGMRKLHCCGPQVVVMTRGGDGEIAVSVGDEIASVAPYRVPVVYDVGAGDTFHAGLAAAALRQDIATMTTADWQQAVRIAAAAAAIRVSTSADPHDLPTFDQVVDWMCGHE